LSRQVDNESRVLVWVQTGQFVTIWPVWNYVLVPPRRARRPRSNPFVPHQIAPGTTAITGGRNRESQAGSSRAVVGAPRAPQYLSASLGRAILESTMGTEKFWYRIHHLAACRKNDWERAAGSSLSPSGGRIYLECLITA